MPKSPSNTNAQVSHTVTQYSLALEPGKKDNFLNNCSTLLVPRVVQLTKNCIQAPLKHWRAWQLIKCHWHRCPSLVKRLKASCKRAGFMFLLQLWGRSCEGMRRSRFLLVIFKGGLHKLWECCIHHVRNMKKLLQLVFTYLSRDTAQVRCIHRLHQHCVQHFCPF